MGFDSINGLWESICEEFKRQPNFSSVGFNVWIRDIKPLAMQAGTLVLGVKNEYIKNTINSYYKKVLEDCCLTVSGLSLTIEILVTNGEPVPDPQVKQTATTGAAGYSFDNFVVGPSNRFAHAAALAVAENPDGSWNPLYLWGNSGLGKTHLVMAIKKHIEQKYPEKKVEYLRGEEFANYLIEAIRAGTTKIFHDRYRSVDVLLLDDIHFIAGRESTQEEFFNTFNVLYQANKQMVITSDRPPKEIHPLDERIRSRFESGLITDVNPPDFETRVGIIRNKAQQLDIDLSEEITFYIAEQIKTNIRQLEGVVKKLHAYILLQNHNPGFSVVQSIIKDIVSDNQPEPITIDRIIEEVERTYSVSKEDILSKRKTAEIALARQVSIYITKQLTQLSFVAIGNFFGKDHTTIMYTINKIDEIIKRDPSQKKLVDNIIKNLQR